VIRRGFFIRKIVILLFCFILVLSFAGCNKESNNKVGIRGEIKKISTNDKGKITGIFVEGKIEQDTEHDKASIYITKKTNIYEENGKKKLEPSSLKEGMKVEVDFEGSVRLSYPIQADAKTVRVLK
jgi:beta-N-acetylhexosaminidase